MPPCEAEASWFSDLCGGIFTFITAPIWVFCPDNPTFRKNSPFKKKKWEEDINFQSPQEDPKDDYKLHLPRRREDIHSRPTENPVTETDPLNSKEGSYSYEKNPKVPEMTEEERKEEAKREEVLLPIHKINPYSESSSLHNFWEYKNNIWPLREKETKIKDLTETVSRSQEYKDMYIKLEKNFADHANKEKIVSKYLLLMYDDIEEIVGENKELSLDELAALFLKTKMIKTYNYVLNNPTLKNRRKK